MLIGSSVPDARDVWASRGITLVVLGMLGYGLLHLPAPSRLAGTGDDAMTVEFIAVRRPMPEQKPRATPLVQRAPRTDVPRSKPPAPREWATSDKVVKGPTSPVATSAEPNMVQARTPLPSFDPPSTRAANPNAFGRMTPDPLEVAPRAVFNVQDRSLAGRLSAMTKRSDCAELRAALRQGGSNTDAIVRTMQARGCI